MDPNGFAVTALVESGKANNERCLLRIEPEHIACLMNIQKHADDGGAVRQIDKAIVLVVVEDEGDVDDDVGADVV